MRLGEVWLGIDIIHDKVCSRTTFTKWRREGLMPLTDDTNADLFLSDDLIEFWKAKRGKPGSRRK